MTKKTIGDVQHEAVLLAGLIEGVFELDNQGCRNAMTASLEVALERARALADDLDDLNLSAREAA